MQLPAVKEGADRINGADLLVRDREDLPPQDHEEFIS